MGATSSRLPWSKKEFVAMMVGLDGAGKTAILNRLMDRRGLHLTPPVPTTEFNVDVAVLPFARVTLWDGGGSPTSRPLWPYYYHRADSFVFVVSALESGRLLEAREALHDMCRDRDIWNRPLLVLVNKSEPLEDDAANPNAAPPEFVSAALDIATCGFRIWTIRAVSAVTGDGLEDAFKWLSDKTTPRPRPRPDQMQ